MVARGVYRFAAGAMTFILRVYGVLGPLPLPAEGAFVADFDFEAACGIGLAKLTSDRKQAKVFADAGAALTYIRTVPKCRPTRADGKPNRPLTGYTVEVMKVPE